MPGRMKWAATSGLLMKESAYELGGYDWIDMALLNVLNGASQYFTLFALPPFQTAAAALGSQEVYGGDGRAKLAAAAGGAAIGQWNLPIGQIANIGLLSRLLAGGVKAYAATLTLQLTLIGASDTSATAILTNLMTVAYALNGPVNIWTVLALNNIPAARQVLGANAQAIPNAFYLYPGDALVAQVANGTGGTITVAAGDQLALGYEIF